MSMLILSGAALAFSGFAAKGIVMDRHYADIHGRGKEAGPATRRRMLLLGWLGLALSFIACIGAGGWHIGPVLWCGVLSIAAWTVTLLLQYAPRKVVHAAWIGVPAALLTAALLLR
ncbi:DUF3325 domain-containing protein [Massilia sp. YIM B02443]|uniref:DUF3325 domain-containing protein n=1 Tax=Massilia sp. YIM B02443 TaxID=3050127 RepID=UPI0025B6535C|nr:DUF3325 domain-containing protein [Massilia sp. YIM B02443]MDN4039524.1 DUF3325 domain-containing protein [Massilia sp. YIM B02443]